MKTLYFNSDSKQLQEMSDSLTEQGITNQTPAEENAIVVDDEIYHKAKTIVSLMYNETPWTKRNNKIVWRIK